MSYCKIESESVWLDEIAEINIGLDLRSDPIDDPMDRVCCRCGESISADGVCDHCETEEGEEGEG